jgi:transketolase
VLRIGLIPFEEFERVRESPLDDFERLALIADMCRANTLSAVKRAGSGHLGSSFSAMDIVVWLYYQHLNTLTVGFDSPDRDVYFSSKGHDVPGLYSLLYSVGALSEEQLLKLRRFGGLDGHPDVHIRGIEANSGSLGMGISKGRGIAWAKRHAGHGGHVYVLTGDGELQEGQNYEALQAAVHQQIGNLTIIVDHNKVQSDTQVCEIMDLGDLEAKFRAFGWHVARCNGHDFAELARVLAEFQGITDRPKALIADTIKGRGISFMEHPAALAAGGGLYRWHAGAPDDASYMAGHEELIRGLDDRLRRLDLAPLTVRDATPETRASSGVSPEYVAEAAGQALIQAAARRPDLVVLDGDLSADCRIRGFERAFPERFIENGIAEQDMVSMAGGLARMGLLPVVHTFASFLAARANEQIYNNASERTKIIYAAHYAGLIPAGPGKSHQSIRDVALLGGLPNLVIIEPCSGAEARLAVQYCVDEAVENCVLRMVIGPSPRILELPANYRLQEGRGFTLRDGDDAVIFGYGPVMLHEALLAAELLAARGFALRVVNMPWLNRVDPAWLHDTIGGCSAIYVIEDHGPVGGLGDRVLTALVANGLLAGRRFEKLAVEGYPACGTPPEALRYHRLDGESLAQRIAPAVVAARS